MKRSLLATLVLSALAGPALAQSTVTVYGVVDNMLTWGKGSLTSLKSVGTGGLAGSRLGFRGVEDLGGGLRAVYVVEHGFNGDTGAQAGAPFWNRQVYVGLGSNTWGELQLGRIYTPTFIVHATYDAFGPQGVAAQHVLLNSIEVAQPANIRANNAINYTAPATLLPGFTLQAMRSAGEGAPGAHSGVRAGWAGGGFAGDLAIGRYDNDAIGDLKTVTAGARYKSGDWTVYGLYDRADSGSAFDTRGLQFSVAWQIGVAELKASVAESERKSASGAAAGTSRRFGLGGVYNLSKRTALYTSLARLTNRDGSAVSLNGSTTAPNEGSSGIDVGIRHVF